MTTSTRPESNSRNGPPTARESSAPAMVAGIPPSSDHAAARGRASPACTNGIDAATAVGIVAGKGEATATMAGTPSSDNTGVATDEPPTPSIPMRSHTASPARTITGQVATAFILTPPAAGAPPGPGYIRGIAALRVSTEVERLVKLDVGLRFVVPDVSDTTIGSELEVVGRPDRRLQATYYDTADLRLMRRGITLRFRREVEEGEQQVAQWTLKL